MTLTDEIREYLSNRYSTDRHYVDPQTDIETEGQNVHVTGVMPNTNEVGQFYAGTLSDIQWNLEHGR